MFFAWTNYLSSGFTWAAVILGAVIGSFLNVCILRVPEGTFLKHQRSICPACGTPIPWYLNVPILSWFMLGGRARCCRSKISLQYPAVESFTAVLFATLYWRFPFMVETGFGYQIDYANLLRCLHAAIFCSVLIVCSVIDLRLMIIPDVISLPMIALTPIVVYVHPDLDWISASLGIVLGGGSLYAIAWLYWIVRREVGMGMGDVKLLAAIGGWLGYQAILPTVLYGSVAGALTGLSMMLVTRRLTLRSAIPFGPFLALGAIIHLFAGPLIQQAMLAPMLVR